MITQQTPEAAPRAIDLVDKRLIANRQGRDFALYAGLLDLAHQQGLLGIETKLEQAPSETNGQLAIVSAIVTFPPREAGRAVRQFTGIGDASPQNVGRMIAMHTVRMAETRAKARALRDALNIGGVALEELGPNGEGEDELDAGAAPERTTSEAPRQLRQGAPRTHTAPVAATAIAAPVEREADAVRNAGVPASSQQRERLSKLQAALGRQPAIPRDLTAAQAAEQTSELVRAFNSQSRKR